MKLLLVVLVLLDSLLAATVKDGVVDYGALRERRAELEEYVASLATVDASELDRNETLALWINAYNACTLLLVLEHPGLESIKDIDSDDRWEAERWKVAGRMLSLDAMEHEILRPMGEPRVHFALVCASKSCPDLRPELYVGERLDAQLDDQARRFLAQPKGLGFGEESGFFGTDQVLRLSRIFDWFEEDFEAQGGVLAFVTRHAPKDAVAWIAAHQGELEIEHLDYDWSLNGR